MNKCQHAALAARRPARLRRWWGSKIGWSQPPIIWRRQGASQSIPEMLA